MARRPRRRTLSADDRAVWDAVTRTARRFEAEKRNRLAQPEGPAPAPAKPPPSATLRATGGETRPTESVVRGLAGITARLQPSPRSEAGQARTQASFADQLPRPVGRPEAGLDKRTAERLRRGERAPDARIDLHGMTADRAHAALDRFMAGAVRQSLRCVLVITGKGGRSSPDDAPWLPAGRGVLRDAAPRWLRSGPFARRIVGIYEAHQRHGGAGAFYVYLKKPREKPGLTRTPPPPR